VGEALRILLAPYQRLPDYFVFIRAGEMSQEASCRPLIDERRKANGFWAAPRMQLDQILTMIEASPK
jgi:hypothetical protein